MADCSEVSPKLCSEHFENILKLGKVKSYRPALRRGLESEFI